MRQMIEELDSEYEEDSRMMHQITITILMVYRHSRRFRHRAKEEYDSDESFEDEPVPQNVRSIWIAKDKTEWSRTHYQAHEQDLVTFCVKGVYLLQTVTCLLQMSYSSQ